MSLVGCSARYRRIVSIAPSLEAVDLRTIVSRRVAAPLREAEQDTGTNPACEYIQDRTTCLVYRRTRRAGFDRYYSQSKVF